MGIDALVLINFSTLFQLLIFSVVLTLPRFRLPLHRKLLLGFFLVLGLSKLDDLWQQTGLVLDYPQWAFIGSMFGLLLGPLIYLYVRARTESPFKLTYKHGVHLLLLLPIVVYFSITWWPLALETKKELFATGEIASDMNVLFWPSYGDAVFIAYLAVAVSSLKKYGLGLQNWFSSVSDKNLSGLRWLLTAWMAIVLIHIVWTWVSGGLQDWEIASWVMLVLISAHLIFVNGLMIESIANSKVIGLPSENQEIPQHHISELEDVLRSLDQLMQTSQPYLNPDLTVAELAQSLRLPARALSQALNQVSQQNFLEFINRKRIEYARSLLLEKPAIPILEVAYESGFNSKSVFNTAFKKYTGMTPSGFRRNPSQ